MRVALVAFCISLAPTAFADKLPPGVSAKDAALIDRVVTQIDHLGSAMYAVRGKCAKVAAVMTATVESDNKMFGELVKLMDGENSKALEAYSQKKYKPRLEPMRKTVEAATLGCRGDKAVADAWSANQLMTETWGKLPPEPEKPPEKPAGYDAAVKPYDAALADYKAAAEKLDKTKDCAAAAKLVAPFNSVRKRKDAVFDRLDQKIRDALTKDNPRMDADMDAYMLFMQARNRCEANAAFAKAVTAEGLDPPKE